MTHLNAEGDERIKQDYLAPSIAGDLIGALCISEPDVWYANKRNKKR
jgi:alkylation response protein AidB-like acyl-CoA dehydrogenase